MQLGIWFTESRNTYVEKLWFDLVLDLGAKYTYLSTWIQKRKLFINAPKYLNIFSFLFLVITMCLIQCSHQQQQCPFADQSYREASTWSRFRSTATFIPTSESLAVDTLLMQTSEMHEIINHFKSQFVSLFTNIK